MTTAPEAQIQDFALIKWGKYVKMKHTGEILITYRQPLVLIREEQNKEKSKYVNPVKITVKSGLNYWLNCKKELSIVGKYQHAVVNKMAGSATEER